MTWEAAACLHRDDAPTPAVEVADDGPHVFLGGDDLDVHDRLQQRGLGAPHRLLEAHGPGDLERHLRRVDLVIRAVGQPHLDVDHRIPGEDAGVHGLADALLDGGHVFPGHRSPRRSCSRTRSRRPPRSAPPRCRRRRTGRGRRSGARTCPGPRPAVGSSPGRPPEACRRWPPRLNSRSRRSTMISRCSSPIPWISVCEVSTSVVTRKVGSSSARRDSAMPSFSSSALRLGLDGDGDHRLGERHRLEHDRLVGVAERVARRGELQPDGRHDVAGGDRLDLLLLVRVHAEEAADALLLELRRVVDGRTRFERAGVHAEEHELPDVLVVHDLEGQRRERLVVRRLALLDLPGLRVEPLHGRDVERRRQEIDDGVEQRLHALVLERGPAQHREHRHADGALAHGRADLVGRDLLATDVLLHQVVVDLGQALDQFLAILPGLVTQIGRDLDRLELLAERLVVRPDVGLHLDEIDQPDELVLGPDRDMDRDGMGAQTRAHHLQGAVVVRADPVHLVDVDDPRHLVLVGLPPHRLRLGLHARHRIQDRHRAVEHAQRALDLHGEVDVSRRVDDVDPAVTPEARGRRGRDGDSALLLLDHPVHRRGAFVHLADLVGPTGVIQDTLGRGRLAGIDVRHDADVPRLLQRVLPIHRLCSSFLVEPFHRCSHT